MRHALYVLTMSAVAGGLAAQANPTDIVPRARTGQAIAAGDGSSELLLHGGESGGTAFDDTWQLTQGAFDRASGGDVEPSARCEHAAAYFPPFSEYFVFGGRDEMGQLSDETWRFDGDCWGTVEPATVPPARQCHSMVYDSMRQVIVMFGGLGTAGELADTWEFGWDTATNAFDWKILFPVDFPSPRSDSGLAYDTATGKVVLCGGSNNDDTWEWDGANWTCRLMSGSPPQVNRRFAMASNPPGGAVLFQGDEDAGVFVGFAGFVTTWTWDSAAGSWTLRETVMAPTSPVGLPAPQLTASLYRGAPSMTSDLTRGRAILHGGIFFDMGNASANLSDAWEWDGQSWTCINPGNAPQRSNGAWAFDSTRGELLATNGQLGNASVPGTWIYDGVSWRLEPEITTNSIHATMAHDSNRGRTLLIGGHEPSFAPVPRRARASWDGSNWSTLTATSPPVAADDGLGSPVDIYHISRSSMAFDPIRDRMVLHGGGYHFFSGILPFIDSDAIWELDPVADQWILTQPAVGPDSLAQIVFDHSRGKIVSLDPAGLWEWDGAQWTLIATTNVPGRSILGYDQRRARLVAMNDTGAYELEGSDWVFTTADISIGPVSDTRLLYDTTLGRLLVVVDTDHIWVYGPASFETLGTGCAGTFGTPTLTVELLPLIGREYRVRVDSIEPGALGAMVFSGSERPVPVDLSPLGMLGCLYYINSTLVQGIDPAGRWSWSVPDRPDLVGRDFFNQAFIVDLSANPFGLIVSNVGRGIIGAN